ncbi:hypothetical protein ACOMHN_061710 [Nucella lapillus]
MKIPENKGPPGGVSGGVHMGVPVMEGTGEPHHPDLKPDISTHNVPSSTHPGFYPGYGGMPAMPSSTQVSPGESNMTSVQIHSLTSSFSSLSMMYLSPTGSSTPGKGMELLGLLSPGGGAWFGPNCDADRQECDHASCVISKQGSGRGVFQPSPAPGAVNSCDGILTLLCHWRPVAVLSLEACHCSVIGGLSLFCHWRPVTVLPLEACHCSVIGGLSLFCHWRPVTVLPLAACHCSAIGGLSLFCHWRPVTVLQLEACHCSVIGGLSLFCHWRPVTVLPLEVCHCSAIGGLSLF